jgi:transcriptional regulator with PAS, ATPase and Fis domain
VATIAVDQDGAPDARAHATLAEVERHHILGVYRELGCNKTRAAERLAISIPTLTRKLRAYGEE